MLGKLYHSVDLYQPTRTEDGRGGYSLTWERYANIAANVQPAGAQYAQIAQQYDQRTSHVVYVRSEARDYISPADVLVFKGRALKVLGIVEIGEYNRYLRIDCGENIPSNFTATAS